MAEQRTQPPKQGSSSATHSPFHSHSNSIQSTSSFTHSPDPPRAASSVSLRHYRDQRKGTHSRRESMDTEGTAPMTYFPNPATFPSTQSQPQSILTSSPPSTRSITLQPPPSRPVSVYEENGGDRTPTMNHGGAATPASSPRNRRDTLPGRRRESTNAQKSVTVAGYGSTSNASSLSALGLGFTSDKKREDVLSSPRRISTSHNLGSSSQPPPSAYTRRSQSPANFILPSHEAYYSQTQPSSANTPRFRERDISLSHTRNARSQDQSPHMERLNIPADPMMRSITSISPSIPPRSPWKSPAGTVMSKLRKRASVVGISLGKPDTYDADGEDEAEDEGSEIGDPPSTNNNGMRVWYSSYATIDWMHDAIKESSRVRKLRHNAHRSLRGALANFWDRCQGWVAVTLIGVISAVVAFLVIRTQEALFEAKEGFCSNSWGTSKRFCCAPHHGPPGSGPEVCEDWVEWGEFFNPDDKNGPAWDWVYGKAEFMTFITMAIALASLASILTIYLSSSAHYNTSKDSAFLVPTPSHSNTALPFKPKTTERQPLLFEAGDVMSPVQEMMIKTAEPPRRIMYYASGGGIPEIKTILSGFVIRGYLGGSTLLVKSVGLALSVASGLSLGMEGPMVHITSCVGNVVSRLFIKFECNEAKRREILSAASAAGVSVAFGAPIGGVLFSLEEVSYYFPPKVMWRSFWCAAVAAMTLKALNPFGNGTLVLFTVTYTKAYHQWDMIIFVIMGVFGGIYGAVFTRLAILWSKNVRQGTWIGRHPIIEVMLVTALTATVSFMNPYLRMGGTELVADMFTECHPDANNPLCEPHIRDMKRLIGTVGSALVIKVGLTIITFGLKLPAGIFVPSLGVGACFGRVVGLGMKILRWHYPDFIFFDRCAGEQCNVSGIYAMVGAAAALAGVTRMTISLAVIMLEVTNSMNYVVPVMLAVLVAKTVADALEKKGIYDLVIDMNQLPYLDAKHEYFWGSRLVSEVAERDVPILRADKVHTVRSLTGKLLELARLGMADTGFPVLVKEASAHASASASASDRGGGGKRERETGCLRVVGFLGMNELEHALAVLADEPDAILNLLPEEGAGRPPRSSVWSIFDFGEGAEARYSPYDISRYIDRAPITVQIYSPLELVQQLFVKLGSRQLLVVDSRGVFKGMVTKKAWLSFLGELERS